MRGVCASVVLPPQPYGIPTQQSSEHADVVSESYTVNLKRELDRKRRLRGHLIGNVTLREQNLMLLSLLIEF